MTENKEKAAILSELSVLDAKTLQIAYLYAKNYVEYGVDVTEKWVTTCQNHANLEKAHYDGYREGYEKAKDVFGDEKVIPDPEKPNLGLDVADSGLKAWTTSPKFKYEIGQIVRKKGGYPDTLTFKVVDRYMVNLICPYYKIQLTCTFHSMKGTSYVRTYEYVPEHSLDLPLNNSDEFDDTHINTFKFHVGDIVKFKLRNNGLYKISARYCYNVKSNVYKIGKISDGYGRWTIVDEDELELVSKR